MMLDVVERSLIPIKHRLQRLQTFFLFYDVDNRVVLVSPSHSTVLHAGVPTKVTLRLSVSMVMVYSLHLFRSLPRQFKLQNGERVLNV